MDYTDGTIARVALTVAVLAFAFACIFALLLNGKIADLENVQPEIHTALTCEQIQGVVVCVER